MAKQRQQKMTMQAGALGAIQKLEHRSDEELQRETKHRAAARAILGARAAERYEAKQARTYFNEALAGTPPRERPALRQMMKASLALAERRPDDLRDAMESMGQTPPSSRQLFVLRLMSFISPPPGASTLIRARGFLLLMLIVFVLMAAGFGLANLVALPFGGVGTVGAVLLGLLIVVAVIGALTLVGRRRQAKAKEAARAG
ncbi:MAG: hypothetical protein QOE06_1524 [Thermoleophilaceae bacterium]|nr:hypothetical protein [Thermoleophilaceae bacterium]